MTAMDKKMILVSRTMFRVLMEKEYCVILDYDTRYNRGEGVVALYAAPNPFLLFKKLNQDITEQFS